MGVGEAMRLVVLVLALALGVLGSCSCDMSDVGVCDEGEMVEM